MALVSTALSIVYFLPKKDPVKHTFFTNLKIVDEALEHKHQDTYDKTFLYTIYRIFFSYNCHIKTHC
jgi:hypothetical protein